MKAYRKKTEPNLVAHPASLAGQFLNDCKKYEWSAKQYRSFLAQQFAKMFPARAYPIGAPMQAVRLLLAYELIRQGYMAAQQPIPVKLQQRIAATATLDPNAYPDDLKALYNAAVLQQGDRDMKSESKVLKKKLPVANATARAVAAHTPSTTVAKATSKTITGVKKGAVASKWIELFQLYPSGNRTDAQLAELMRKEFPTKKSYTEADVRLHRSLYNHGNIKGQKNAPAKKAMTPGKE